MLVRYLIKLAINKINLIRNRIIIRIVEARKLVILMNKYQ
jgi:hypothetical protein